MCCERTCAVAMLVFFGTLLRCFQWHLWQHNSSNSLSFIDINGTMDDLLPFKEQELHVCMRFKNEAKPSKHARSGQWKAQSYWPPIMHSQNTVSCLLIMMDFMQQFIQLAHAQHCSHQGSACPSIRRTQHNRQRGERTVLR